MKSQACQPERYTEKAQPIDLRANPISPEPAVLKTEIIPTGHVQSALYLRFVVRDHIREAYKMFISNAEHDNYATGRHV